MFSMNFTIIEGKSGGFIFQSLDKPLGGKHGGEDQPPPSFHPHLLHSRPILARGGEPELLGFFQEELGRTVIRV